jgi:L-fuconolactonase
MSSERSHIQADPIWKNFLDDPWLSQVREEILAPDLPIVDPHHHIWWSTNPHMALYRLDEFVLDVTSGHNVVGSVFMETSAMYRATGPERFRVVGEVEFIRGLGAMSASGGFGPLGLCTGIIGACDLTQQGFQEVLDAQIEAGGSRFKGIRVNAQNDPEEGIGWGASPPEHFMLNPALQSGVAYLGELGLTCDLMCFHPQLSEAALLADAAPNTRIVMNHVGGPLGVGAWSKRVNEVGQAWSVGLKLVAERPNVWLKMGGLANPFFCGIMYRDRELPPTSEELAAAYRTWFDRAVDIFGPSRVMFESNFPADRVTVSYQVLWNAFKRLCAGLCIEEQRALLAENAIGFYSLEIPDPDPDKTSG